MRSPPVPRGLANYPTTMGAPTLESIAPAWRDEAHVIANRAEYATKFAAAMDPER